MKREMIIKKVIAGVAVASCVCGLLTGCLYTPLLPEGTGTWADNRGTSIAEEYTQPPTEDIRDDSSQDEEYTQPPTDDIWDDSSQDEEYTQPPTDDIWDDSSQDEEYTQPPTDDIWDDSSQDEEYTQPPTEDIRDDFSQFEVFTEPLGVFQFRNEEYIDAWGQTNIGAWIGVYVVDSDRDISAEMIAAFEEFYGFTPSAIIQGVCVGGYLVEGYYGPQNIILYTMLDTTYWYSDRTAYQVYSQVCDDGSIWVGFFAYGSMDEYIASGFADQRIHECEEEALALFEELLGKPIEQMKNCKNQGKHGPLAAVYVESGKGRLEGHEGLTEIFYICYRGFICNDSCCNPGADED